MLSLIGSRRSGLFADSGFAEIPAHVWAVLFAPVTPPSGMTANALYAQMVCRPLCPRTGTPASGCAGASGLR